MNPALAAVAAATLAAALPSVAQAETPAEIEAAKNEVWALEQSIYAGRAKGDISNYLNNVAPGYLSWPPTMPAPMRSDRLQVVPPAMRQTHEQLTMTFMDFSVHNNVAVIYYKTHRTQRADGTACDDHFETTHTWVKEDGKWRVFGGMARPATVK